MARVITGRVLLTGSPQPLAQESSTVRSLAITALSSNAGTAYIGNTAVDAALGFPMEPGAFLGMDVIDPSQVYVLGTGTVAWLGLMPS